MHEKAIKTRVRSQQMPTQPMRIPPLLIWTIMLLASITGLYFSRGWISQVFSPYFSRPPATHIPTQAQAPQPAKENVPAQGTVTPATDPAQVPVQPTVTAAATAITTTLPDEPPPGTMRLQFEVTQACWMSLTGDGTRVYSGVLRPGETPQFDARNNFDMVLGNAGGIKLKINGKPAKLLGAPGAVIKILINADTIPDLIEKVLG